jgi:Tfp pilus assembly protein PilF
MPELDERVAAWIQRVRAGVRRAVELELDAFEEQAGDDAQQLAALRRVRAELAGRDHGPISDLLRAVEDGDEHRTFTLAAARRLARLHGQPLVDELLAEIDASQLPPEEASDAAAIAAEAGDWAEAARCRERMIEDAPEADDAPRHRAAAGFAWWAAGDLAAARKQLAILRDATRELDDGEARYLHHEANAWLEAFDRARTDRPSWIRVDAPAQRSVSCGGGRGLLGLLAWLDPNVAALPSPPLPTDPDDHPTAAHVRRRLDAAGIAYARVRFDEASIEAALRGGAWVVLEEERPTDTGFVWVRAWDPIARVLEVIDPARSGPMLRRFDAQRERGALFAMSGFVIPRRGTHTELAHDPALDLVDACDLDEDGREPPRARVEAIAAAALEAHPDLPMLHRRRGEALLAKLSSGDIEAGPRGAFETWLAATRERFPDAEWPFQLHARALELQGRIIESCIAWKDAALRDPYDYRNALGQARAFAREGGLWAAYRALRRAATLAPGVGEIEGMLALNALHRNDRAQLKVHARLARALAPGDARAIMASATAAEHDREFDRAVELLAALAERDDVGAWAPARLHRRHVEAGRWAEARRVAEAACQRFPADASVWVQASAAALAEGDVPAALELACAGIDRCGATDELLEAALDGAIFQSSPGDHRERIEVIVRRVLPQPSRADAVVRRLVEIGDEDLAIDVARRAAAAFGRDLDGPWLLARSLLRTKATRAQHDAEIAALLDRVVAGSGSFPYPRVFLALDALGRGEPERALAVLEPADVARSPVLVWELTARALDALGRSPAAEALRARLPEGYPAGVLSEVGFLSAYGHATLAAELLDAMLAHRDHEGVLDVARCWSTIGDHARAFATIAEKEDEIDASDVARMAERVRRWDVVQRAAARFVAELEIDSSGVRDVWEWRAVEAAAAAVRGDPGLRDRFRERAPRHVRAWRRLVQIERAAELPEAAADIERLRSIAPGALEVST